MSKPTAIYTTFNCKFAYQLRWGVTVYWKTVVDESVWINKLKQSLAADELQILSWRWYSDNSVQFAISAQPKHSPLVIIQRIKGRLQYAVRDVCPKALLQHYAIRSYGTQNREVIEAYVAKQVAKHPVAAEHSQVMFQELSFSDHNVDLSVELRTQQGSYWYNLHIVLVNESRWRTTNRPALECVRSMVIRWAELKQLRLSRFSILADHMHLAIGCRLEMAPETIALSLMNNIAWTYQMRPVLTFSAFAGTFGEYDQRVVVGSREFD